MTSGGIVASHKKEAEVHNGVSTDDVPSAAWGWSALSTRAMATAGICGGLFLLAMLFGNHHGNVENIYLIVLAVVCFIGTTIMVTGLPGKQSTRLHANNKPVGHIEPNWSADQKNLTGAYADLSDEELLALNIKK
ncbi:MULTISPECIES: DUF2631 domain-containing protein [Corynebacterium]|uniref:DUF2631 domain-containing protein n=1 Tax=Corynebacterium TaxID=1716 RepID=UPI001CE3FEF6|nr:MULTISPECIES: DUF2631 domain-containing protein [Corynebacterium]